MVDPLVCLENQLNYVPECLRSNLETKWTGMHGSQKEIDMLKYILRNACCLKTATILFKSTPDTEDKHKTMIQELLLSSTTCGSASGRARGRAAGRARAYATPAGGAPRRPRAARGAAPGRDIPGGRRRVR